MKKIVVFLAIFLILIGVFCLSDSFDYVFGSNANIEKDESIDFGEPVVINFSSTLLSSDDFSDKVNISPQTNVRYTLKNKNRSLQLIPESGWNMGEKYKIEIDGVKNILLANANEKLTFSTRKYPEVIDFYPQDKARGIVIDIEDPIRINFDESLADFRVKMDISPKSEMEYKVGLDKKSLSFAFKRGYQKGENYNVDVYIRHKKEEKYSRIYTASFETEAPPIEEWSNDFALRLEQARKFTEAKVGNGKYIDINLKKQILSIFDNGSVVDAYLISSGKRGMDTPRGTFKVSNKHPRPWSKKYSLFMPYWMAIVPSGKFGIHELPEWPSGYKEGENHLGIPVSHGCIRLGVGAAEKVYKWADIGTPIIVY
ncbi:L,D-transpeptidase [Patescibacteria group bacterium]